MHDVNLSKLRRRVSSKYNHERYLYVICVCVCVVCVCVCVCGGGGGGGGGVRGEVGSSAGVHQFRALVFHRMKLVTD